MGLQLRGPAPRAASCSATRGCGRGWGEGVGVGMGCQGGSAEEGGNRWSGGDAVRPGRRCGRYPR